MNMIKPIQYETLTTTHEGLMCVTIFVKEADCTSKDDAFNQALEQAKKFLKFPVLKPWVITEGNFSHMQKNPHRNKQNDYVFLFKENG